MRKSAARRKHFTFRRRRAREEAVGRPGVAEQKKTPSRGVLVNSRLNDAKLISRPKVAVRRCKKLRSLQTNGPFWSRKRAPHREGAKNETNLGIIRFHHFPTSSLSEKTQSDWLEYTLGVAAAVRQFYSFCAAGFVHFHAHAEREKTESWIIPVIFISRVTTPLRLTRSVFFTPLILVLLEMKRTSLECWINPLNAFFFKMVLERL